MMKHLVLVCVLTLLCGSINFAMGNDVRIRRQAQQQNHQQQNYQQPQANYRPLKQAPAGIQQLLQFQQAREPLVQIAAQPPPNLGPAPSHPVAPPQPSQAQVSQYRPNVQYGQAPPQPNYKNQAAAIASQYAPQNQQPQGPPQYNPQYNPQQQPQYNPQQQPQYNPQQQPQYNPQQQPQQPQYQG